MKKFNRNDLRKIIANVLIEGEIDKEKYRDPNLPQFKKFFEAYEKNGHGKGFKVGDPDANWSSPYSASAKADMGYIIGHWSISPSLDFAKRAVEAYNAKIQSPGYYKVIAVPADPKSAMSAASGTKLSGYPGDVFIVSGTTNKVNVTRRK